MSGRARIHPEPPDAPPPEVLEELCGYEVAWISDSMGRNLMDPRLRAIHPGVPRIAGPALTVQVPPGDFLMVTAALMHSRPGDVLVVDGRGDESRAVWGEYFSGWARGLGLRGVIIDGATRDATAIEALGFPVFARSTTARQPTLNGPGEVNATVSCGGVPVSPGDIVVADREGAIVIPRTDLEPVLHAVRRTAEGERTKHGFPVGDRRQFEAFYERAFAPQVESALGREPGEAEG